MRYAIFSALYPPHLGGVELYTRNLAHRLAARGDEVTVVTSALDAADEGREVDDAGVAVLRLPAIPAMGGRLPLIRPFSPWRRALDEVAGDGVDRVVVNTRFYPLSLAGVEFGGSRGIPTLVIDHGSGFLTLENPVADRAIEAYERAVTAWQRRWHPRYAGVSKRSARWLATLGIETDLVVPNAIDADAFRAESTGRDFRSELGIGPDEPLAVFAARLIESKGVPVAIDAARFLPGTRFVIAGSGPMEDASREADRSLANVDYVGPLSHGDLSALLAQGDVLCQPSEREGFGAVLLEAGAWGCLPVSTRVGIADELVGDSGRGVLLDRRTPLALAMGVDGLLSLPSDERAELGRELAHEVEARWGWDSTLRALDRAFA